jgi:hypothetical protein
MQVRWSPQAAEDLAAIVAHIRKDDPAAATLICQIPNHGPEKLLRFTAHFGEYSLAGHLWLLDLKASCRARNEPAYDDKRTTATFAT